VQIRPRLALTCGSRRLAVAGLALLLAPSGVRAEELAEADEPAAPEELFLGEPPQVQEPLELQVTSGLRWRARRDEIDAGVPLAVELGLTEHLQVEVESRLDVAGDENGTEVSRFETGLLFALRREAPFLLSAGLSAEFEGVGGPQDERAWAVEPAILIQQPLGRFGANLRLGGEREKTFDEEGSEMAATAALSLFAALPQVFPTAEIAIEAREEETAIVAAAGLAWAPMEGVEIGMAMPVQLAPDAPRAGVIVSLTWEAELAGAESEP
jgi:hypothetical protein